MPLPGGLASQDILTAPVCRQYSLTMDKLIIGRETGRTGTDGDMKAVAPASRHTITERMREIMLFEFRVDSKCGACARKANAAKKMEIKKNPPQHQRQPVNEPHGYRLLNETPGTKTEEIPDFHSRQYRSERAASTQSCPKLQHAESSAVGTPRPPQASAPQLHLSETIQPTFWRSSIGAQRVTNQTHGSVRRQRYHHQLLSNAARSGYQEVGRTLAVVYILVSRSR